MKKFWYSKELNAPFLETIDTINFALMEQWFWVLTKIDIKAKLKEKLDKDIEEYVILWACNPLFANEALDAEYEIWLLLPCNVIVYRKNWKTIVSAITPTVAMNMIDNDTVKFVAKKAEEKLKKAIDSL